MSKCDPGLLAAVPLFADLSARELKQLAGVAKSMTYRPGTVVVEEGTPGGRFFAVQAGTAKVLVGGRTRATLGPGAYFGELAVIDDGPRTASVVAIDTLEVWSIAEFNFRALIKQSPGIATKLLRALATRLREAERSYVS